MKSGFSVCAAVGALLVACSAGAVGVPGQGTWKTTLLPRDLDGNAVNGPEAFYDTALNITWLRNATMYGNWSAANTWANTLLVGGIGGWRLPTMVDTGTPGCNDAYGGTDCGFNVQTATSELAHLWYVTLGNKALYDTAGNTQPGWGKTNTGDFEYMGNAYWSGLGYAPDPGRAWYFWTWAGEQTSQSKTTWSGALAVHTGDVAPVPEPQTYALMLMGISALVLALRRRPR